MKLGDWQSGPGPHLQPSPGSSVRFCSLTLQLFLYSRQAWKLIRVLKSLRGLGAENFKSNFNLNFRAEKKKFFFNEKLMRVLKTLMLARGLE